MRIFKMILFIYFLIFVINVKAISCSDKETLSLGSKVNISYQYNDLDTKYHSFYLIINGLTKDLYLIDDNSNQTINGTGDTIIKEGYYEGNSYSLRVFAKTGICKDVRLKTIYIKLPNYNYYADTQVCKENPKFELCNPWTQENIDNHFFNEEIGKYLQKEEKDIISIATVFETISIFIQTYYTYIGLGLTLIIGLVVYLVIKRKRKAKL